METAISFRVYGLQGVDSIGIFNNANNKSASNVLAAHCIII